MLSHRGLWESGRGEHKLETSPVVPAMLQLLLAQPLADYDLFGAPMAQLKLSVPSEAGFTPR